MASHLGEIVARRALFSRGVATFLIWQVHVDSVMVEVAAGAAYSAQVLQSGARLARLNLRVDGGHFSFGITAAAGALSRPPPSRARTRLLDIAVCPPS